MVGLGGVDRAMRMLIYSPAETSVRMCSCGVAVPECRYWGEVLRCLKEGAQPVNLPDRYALAMEVFYTTFGKNTVPVDSSKIKEPLAKLRQLPSLDVRVIHLSKDFRTAATSYTDNKRRKGSTRRPGWLLASEGVWKWWRENQKLEKAISSSGWSVLRVGYEGLCLQTQETLSTISAFAGLPDPGETDNNLRETQSHLFIGNRMRKEAKSLRYDNRWMRRTDWLPAALLMPWVHRANRRWVHQTQPDEAGTKGR